MEIVLAYLALVLLIAIEIIWCKRLFSQILLILKIPAVLFIAYGLFWFWGGDGMFNLIVVPIVLVLLELGILVCLKKLQRNIRIRLILINAMLFIVPVITILLTDGIAKLFGVDIQIM